MILPKYGLRYEHCTHCELWQFLRTRTHEKVSKDRNLYFYIKRLRHLDESANFRFLDLPPELRNAVYEQLFLPYPSPREPLRHLAILATCQRLRDEGEYILYGDIEFRIRLDLTRNFVKLGISEPCRQVLQTTVGIELVGDYRIWPEFVQKMRHASVEVMVSDAIWADWGGVGGMIGHPFWGMWQQFFGEVFGARRLKTLEIVIVGKVEGECGYLGDLLEKVALLPELEEFGINGRRIEMGQEFKRVIDGLRCGQSLQVAGQG